MPKPFKPSRSCPIPPDAERIDRDGVLHVRVRVNGKFLVCPLSEDGTKYLRPAKCWYFNLRTANGTVKRVRGYSDLKATEQLAAEMERKQARKRAGITDPSEEHLRRPLADHLKDYAAALEAKGGTARHVRETIARCSAMFKGAGFTFPMDVDAGKASEWLNNRRRDRSPRIIPAGDSFRPGEVASILGVSLTALSKSMKRQGLTATGNGKARRVPRIAVEALVANRAKGTAPETVNHYIRAVRGFFRWLLKTKRIGANPLETLNLLNSAIDLRRIRRELTADELRRLFDAARKSDRNFRGLSGVDRFTLYLTAAGTGFRASALSHLTPADFDLGSPTPSVTLAARFAKNRRTKVQPIPTDVANVLREFVEGKPVNAPVWGGTWASDYKGAEMLRIDLEAAGIAYAVEGPDGPEYADFHSLRHSYLTLGGRSGIDLRTLQELAGHSTPALTARYSHRRLHDLTGAVEKLPNLVPTSPGNTNPELLRMTGTEGPKSAPPGALDHRAEPHFSALICTNDQQREFSVVSAESVDSDGICTNSHSSAPGDESASYRTRTYNPLIKSQLLCQLS